MSNGGSVLLYKALLAVVNGAEIERRGLDVADDPNGYTGSPGTRGRGGAYFATAASLALTHVPLRDYRNGLLVVTLLKADYDALCASGGILPDTLHAPGTSVRVQPTAFVALNAATTAPKGSRRYFRTGSVLPTGEAVPYDRP